MKSNYNRCRSHKSMCRIPRSEQKLKHTAPIINLPNDRQPPTSMRRRPALKHACRIHMWKNVMTDSPKYHKVARSRPKWLTRYHAPTFDSLHTL